MIKSREKMTTQRRPFTFEFKRRWRSNDWKDDDDDNNDKDDDDDYVMKMIIYDNDDKDDIADGY